MQPVLDLAIRRWMGLLHYALNASEIVQYGYYGSGNASASAVLSGDIAYSSTSVNTPFNMLFAGGVILAESGQQNTTTYENLAVSQGLITGKWVLGLSDSVSFLPQSPTTGLSGIAGVGDIGAVPIQGPSAGPAGGILTSSGSRLSNSLSGNVERLLTGKTSISGTGTWTILHFLHGNDGFDSTQVSGQAGLNHRIDARDSVSVNGVYSVVTFGANEGNLSFTTRGNQRTVLTHTQPNILDQRFGWAAVGRQFQQCPDSRELECGSDGGIGFRA